MAIFNTNEFLRKTFSKTIFGTAALRPEAVCADGFTLSIQASGMHYCIPNEDLSDGNYSKVELSYLSEEVEEFLPFAEDDEAPLATVYGYVPVETEDTATSLMSWLQRVKNATRQQIIKKVASSSVLAKIKNLPIFQVQHL